MKKIKLLFSVVLCILLISSCKDSFEYNVANNGNSTHYNATKYALGITRISSDSLAFKLFAPNKQEVYLIGDFNRWMKLEKYKMKKDEATNTFFLKIGNLSEQEEYVCQYLVSDGNSEVRIGDPYATKTSDPLDKYISTNTYPNMITYPSEANNDIAMVVSTKTDEYAWNVTDFNVQNPSNLVIYEMLIRDFTGSDDAIGNIKDAKDKIPYLKALGITAVELMPFNEFEGNESWGYNPTYYFATDKAYGTRNDYKAFIDECHEHGIAVIMDMVLNHAYGQCPLAKMYVASDWTLPQSTAYFNQHSPNTDYSWGYDFNHESLYTQQFVDSVCSFWMSEFKIDGFRFDFTKGFTQKAGNGWDYDASRIAILKRMSDEIWKRKDDAIIIMEHLTDNSEEKVLADYGIYLWGNMNTNFNESTMGWGDEQGQYGYKGDFTWASYKNREWTKPNLIAYMESHDEERLMFKNEQWGREAGSYSVKNIPTALQRNAAAMAIYMSIPGPKMIWQFGELGYDVSIDDNGRTGLKPVGWKFLEDSHRVDLKDKYTKMIHLKNTNKVFETTDYEIEVDSNLKQVLLRSTDTFLCTIANLNVVEKTIKVNFEKMGTWTDEFTGEKLTVNSKYKDITLQPGEFKVFIN